MADIRPQNGVVRPGHTRPAESAPWCTDPRNGFEPGACPLFWSDLIEGGPDSRTPVLGLGDAVVGKKYNFFCSIHPRMVGTLEVLA